MAIRTRSERYHFAGATEKIGCGIELTTEALIELVAQRFPELVDWRTFQSPSLEVANTTGAVGMYQTYEYFQLDRGTEPTDRVARPFRRMGEGAPVPSLRLSTRNLVTDDGHPRCGHYQFAPGDDINAEQCDMVLNHEGQHGKVTPLR